MLSVTMTAPPQLDYDVLLVIGIHWPARALGLTCKRLGHLLDPDHHVITRTDVDDMCQLVISQLLPDGRLHGESVVERQEGDTIQRIYITSHLGMSTVCIRSWHGSGRDEQYARSSIYRGREYFWQFGTLVVIEDRDMDATPHGFYTWIAKCTLDECAGVIAKYALDRPHGDRTTLDVASYSLCLDMPGLEPT